MISRQNLKSLQLWGCSGVFHGRWRYHLACLEGHIWSFHRKLSKKCAQLWKSITLWNLRCPWLKVLQLQSRQFKMGSVPFVCCITRAQSHQLGGSSIGTYKTLSHLYLQTRNGYLNEIPDEPLGDVESIETSASSNLCGRFEISIFGYTLRWCILSCGYWNGLPIW